MNDVENLTDRQVEATPKSADMKLLKETSFHQSRDLRERYNIQVSKQKYMSLHDFILSLELDHSVLGLVQREKQEIGNFIHFFDVEIQHGGPESAPLKWTIRKRFLDFVALDKSLTKELVDSNKIPRARVPLFSEFYSSRTEGVADTFMDAAEKYMTALLQSQEIRQNSIEIYEFIELSLIPFGNANEKIKEGFLKKRSGGRFKRNKFKFYCSMLFSNWQERWFRLTQEGIIYGINSSSTKPREMLLFDQSFRIEYGRKATGVKTGITLKTPGRVLNLQAPDIFQALDWVAQIQLAAKSSPYTKMNRYLSFAPVREPTNYCKWYVDAEGYFEELHDVLLQAKKEVFITDWWLSPEVALKRPVADSESEYRLDKVLGRIANSGVKVYVIVYHEVKMVMYNDSEHTKKALESLSPNITVLKHPSEPFFSWSHHEKLVVVDQQIGFVGGFDLCFGRWDTNSHPLHDPAMAEGKGETFQGQDYANPRLLDFRNVKDHEHPLIDKESTPRMPFHDAMIKVIGPVVADLSRHFIQYWNHVEVDVYGKEEEAPLPQNVVAPPVDEEALRRENAAKNWKGAFRKIFGMRTFANAVQNQTPKNNEEEPLVGPAAGHALALKRANTTMNGDKARQYNRLGTFSQLSYQQIIGSSHHLGQPKPKDEFNVPIHQANIDKNAPHQPLKGSSFKKNVMNAIESNSVNTNTGLPAYEDQDVLIKGKTDKAEEPRFARKIIDGLTHQAHEEEEGKEEQKMNPIVKRTLLSLADKRKTKTMHHINNPKALPNPEEEQKYKEKYSHLLKKIKDSEKEFDNDVQMSQSRTKQQQRQAEQGVMSKFFGGQEEPEKDKLEKQFSDNFYQKNMLQLLFSPETKQPQGTCAVQMVRSAAKWSLGLNSKDGGIENSIQNAYIEIIQNSKSFIYIENQFFMSSTAGKTIKNEVAKALLYRIEKAHAAGEKFRVVVFLPLLPAFEGEVIDSKAALLRIQMHWQYMTICRGGESIYEELRNKGIVPENYIQFYGLRTHGKMLNGQPATEIIYIHSKILIADDDILLIGSANINDRSLQGSRDSEIAMIFEDSKKMTSYMDDVEVQVGEFACTFRRRLMAEHLGLSDTDVEDPLSDEFIERMNDITQQNTDTYREVFACYPDDNVKTLDELEDFGNIADLSKYDELAPKIQGHAVWFPLEFLENEQLKPPMSSMEYYIPDQTFV